MQIDLRFTTIMQPVPEFVYAGLQPYVSSSNVYHCQPDELRQKIADTHNVDTGSVFLVAGADQAIQLFCMMYGRRTHIFTPTYITYTDAGKMGGELHEHYSLKDGEYAVSTDHIPGASLVFVANPNNPFGITTREKILELVANNPQALIVVDEVYAEFADQSVLKDVQNCPNLAVIRSFSKSYALAGFRIGYVVAQQAVLKRFDLEALWCNVSYAAVGAASICMDHDDHFAAIRQQIIRERDTTVQWLQQNQYKVVPGMINAVTIQLASTEAASRFKDYMAQNDVLVGQGNGASNCGLDDTFVRASIGAEEQMERFRMLAKSFEKV